MPQFDPQKYSYPSRRNVVYARRAMACTSVPLGAQIGLDVMKAGGNAMDAAVAMAAAMPILEPTGNGLGSDCFALIWVEKEKKLYGLNASGVAPMALDAKMVRAMGHSEMPKTGWLPTMVPGAPRAGRRSIKNLAPSPCPNCLLQPSPMPGRDILSRSIWSPSGRRTPSVLPLPGPRNLRLTPIGGIPL